MAQAAFDHALAYARERQTFGKPIFEHQAVQFRLADMDTRIEAARQMVLNAARMKDAGLPWLRLHDLRHNYASMLVNSGRTLYEVQQILGHSQASVTERYAHLSTATLQEAANSVGTYLDKALGSSGE